MITGDPLRQAGSTPLTRWDQASFLPTQIARLYDEVAGIGEDPSAILAAAHVNAESLRSSDTRVSLRQILEAYRTAASLSADPEFAFLMGTRNKVTYYGMYGFAVMSAPDLATMLDFISEAQTLSANLVDLRIERDADRVALCIEPLIHHDIDTTLHRFLVEELLGLAFSAFRDMLGEAFSPSAIRLTYPEHDSATRLAELIGVPVSFGEKTSAFVFDASWLSAPLQFGNRVVHSSARKTCAALLGELRAQAGLAHRVGEALIAYRGRIPPIEEIAAQFGMSERDLRRKLSAEGSGYRLVCDDVRSQISMKYLRDTSLSIDQIASIMGFDNAANLRRAFRRWTDMTPTEYRIAAASEKEPDK